MKTKRKMTTLLSLALSLLFVLQISIPVMGAEDPPTNLVVNPGFEDGGTGWRYSSGAVTITTSTSHSGTKAAYMGGLANGRWLMTDEITPSLIDPARTYRLSVWMKISATLPESTVNLKFGASEYASATIYSGFSTADCFTVIPVKDLTTAYQQFEFTFTGAQLLSNSPTNLMAGLVADGGWTGTPYVYFDDFELIEKTHTITTSTPDNRGTITGNTDVPTGESSTMTITPNSHCEIADVKVNGVSQGAISSYTFVNVTENQTIEATFNVLDENLIDNPGFEDDLIAWKPWAAGTLGTGANAHSGTGFYYISQFTAGRRLITDTPGISPALIDPARTYSLSVWIKASALKTESPSNIKFGASAYNAYPTYSGFGTADCFTVIPVKDITTAYQKYELTFTGTQLLAGNPSNLMVGMVFDVDDTAGPPYFYFDDFELIAQPDLPGRINVESVDGGSFKIGIEGWNASHSYQIWTYQETESEIFGGEGLTNQWVLSHPYTLGSRRDVGGFTVDGDAIARNIGAFTSVDNKYTVAVKVIDGEGNYIGQYKDTFTPAEANVAGISKITVDGQFADEKAFVKDIASSSPVQFVVTGNGSIGSVFTAKVDQTSATLTGTGTGLNEFSWDISGMQPGNYSVTLKAATATNSDSRTINFRLYDSTVAAASYGIIGGTTFAGPGTETDTHFAIDVTAAGITGAWFRYRISEPWGPTVRFSDSIDASGGNINASDSNSILKGKYGIYQVTGYTYRNDVSSADDGFVRTVNYARPGGATLDVTVDSVLAGAGVIANNKGDLMEISASTNIPSPEYSFWRRDANGWVMIRGYEEAGAVTWRPNRVGLYTIQVRAKEAGGLTYEVLKNIEFYITEAGGDEIAEITDITINQAALEADATARTPILITANAVSTSQDLLYKFIISNGYIYYVETAYSADPTYMWVPGKAGNYTINVLVKNQVSFGKYDAIDSFTVDVN